MLALKMELVNQVQIHGLSSALTVALMLWTFLWADSLRDGNLWIPNHGKGKGKNIPLSFSRWDGNSQIKMKKESLESHDYLKEHLKKNI